MAGNRRRQEELEAAGHIRSTAGAENGKCMRALSSCTSSLVQTPKLEPENGVARSGQVFPRNLRLCQDRQLTLSSHIATPGVWLRLSFDKSFELSCLAKDNWLNFCPLLNYNSDLTFEILVREHKDKDLSFKKDPDAGRMAQWVKMLAMPAWQPEFSPQNLCQLHRIVLISTFGS